MSALGFRTPADWIAQGASGEVDADVRLHLPIVWYACSLGYAQQEDEVLGADLPEPVPGVGSAIARDVVMRVWTGQPKQSPTATLPAQSSRPPAVRRPSSCQHPGTA